jgi:hypothetical protein
MVIYYSPKSYLDCPVLQIDMARIQLELLYLLQGYHDGHPLRTHPKLLHFLPDVIGSNPLIINTKFILLFSSNHGDNHLIINRNLLHLLQGDHGGHPLRIQPELMYLLPGGRITLSLKFNAVGLRTILIYPKYFLTSK